MAPNPSWQHPALSSRFVWGPDSCILEETTTHTTARLHDSRADAPVIVKAYVVPNACDDATRDLAARLWRAEARSLLRLRTAAHPGLVQVVAADFDRTANVYYVAWEDNYAATLREILARQKPAPFPRLHDRIECATMLAQALLEMHSRGVVHRDIRPETICVWNEHRRVAFSQFGDSIFLNSALHAGERSFPTAQPRTIRYASPERCAYLTAHSVSTGEGFSSDIFSLGVVLSEWLIKDLPDLGFGFAAYDPEAHRRWVEDHASSLHAVRLTHDEDVWSDLVGLIRDMIAFDHRHRLRGTGELVRRWLRLRNLSRRRLIAPRMDSVFYVVLAENRVLEHMGPAIEAELYSRRTTYSEDVKSGYAQVRAVIGEDLGAEVTIAPSSYRLGECLIVGSRFVYRCALFAESRSGTVLTHLLMVQSVLPARQDSSEWDAGITLAALPIRVLSLLDQGSPDHINGYKRRLADVGDWSQFLADIRTLRESSAPHAGPTAVLAAEARQSREQSRAVTLDALKRLLEAKRAEAWLQSYAYRLVDPPESTVPASGAANQDPLFVWIAADEAAELAVLNMDPVFGALRGDFEGRLDLVTFVRHLAVAGGEPRLGLAASRESLASAPVRAVVDDDGKANDRVRLRILGGIARAPTTAGWLRPSDVTHTTSQERAALERLAGDNYKLDVLDAPAYAAVPLPRGLHLDDDTRSHLSPSKLECLELAASTFPLFVLKGPPGTGKTETVRALVTHIFADDPSARVLVCAQSHRPLDNLLERVAGALREVAVVRFPSGEYTGTKQTTEFLPVVAKGRLRARIERNSRRALANLTEWAAEADLIRGSVDADEATCQRGSAPMEGSLEHRLQGILERWVGAVSQNIDELWQYHLRGASLVGVSCVGAEQLARVGLPAFDWVIVEEAARAHATELLIALTLGNRWFLLGDHDQIGPYRLQSLARVVDAQLAHLGAAAKSDNAKDLATAVASRAKELAHLFPYLFSAAGTAQRGELRECFRMHPTLVELVGRLFYSDDAGRSRLVSAASAEERSHFFRATWTEPDWLQGRALVVLDTSAYRFRHEVHDNDPSHLNLLEVEVCRILVERLTRQIPHPIERDFLACLTVYSRQSDAINEALSQQGLPQSSHTIMAFQGHEADVGILSLVRSNAYHRPTHALGTIAQDEHLNVALSRARRLLIIVGDLSHFRSFAGAVPRIGRLIELLDEASPRSPTDLAGLEMVSAGLSRMQKARGPKE